MTTLIIILCGVMLIGGAGIVVFGSMPKKKSAALMKAFYKKAHRILTRNFLTVNAVRKISARLEMLSLYRQDEIPALTVKYFIIASGTSAGAAALGIFLARDTLSRILFFVLAAVLYNVMTAKQVDRVYSKMLAAASRTFSSLELAYMITQSIPDALNECSPEPLMRRPIDELHGILTGSDGQLKLAAYLSRTPFRPLQTLASVSYNLSVSGDTPDKQGILGYSRALTILRGDIDSEIERMTRQKALFGSLEYMMLLPLPVIAPVEAYFQSVIPGTAMIYNGLLGSLLRTVLIVISIAGYVITSNINSGRAVKDDDRSRLLTGLLKRRGWRNFARSFVPKKLKTRAKLQHKLRSALSRQTTEQFCLKKALFAVFAFVTALGVLQFACIQGRVFARETTEQLSLVGGIKRTPEELAAMRVIDETYFESGGKMNDNELNVLTRMYLPALSDLERITELARIRSKYEMYEGIYFKWWYVLVAAVLGGAGWAAPALILKVRTWLVTTEIENDFMQLQTLASILTYTEMDTLSVLGELQRASVVHKDILREAYHNYPSNPELELERLKSRVTMPDFKAFVEKLKLTVSELPMSEAFHDLLTERETFTRLRQITMIATLNKRRAKCGTIFTVVLFFFIAAEFIVPIGILGVREFLDTLGAIQNF